MFFILYCAHLFVSLTLSKILLFDNKKQKISLFVLYCAHLFVSLQAEIK